MHATFKMGRRPMGILGTLAAAPTSAPVISQAHSTSGEGNVMNYPNTEDDDKVCHNGDDSCPADAMQNPNKDKTPMCLINELARFNKIQHQYRLTGEEGPPHKKRFTVMLMLGDEEYAAEGPSIKKAQHSAASEALKATAYRQPPPKTNKNARISKNNITPTVELNALAMKRGEPTLYTFVEVPTLGGQWTPANSYNNMYNQRAVYNARYYNTGRKSGFVYKVKLRVGEREFSGEGPSAQAARHDAAAKALQQLSTLPVPASEIVNAAGGVEETDGVVDADSSSDLKSPISLVHEVALKRNLPVSFDVISEKGPPHMRTFVTRCSVGDLFQTTAEGNGKKVSKKRAAEKMLEQLRTLPLTATVTAPGIAGNLARAKRKPNPTKKKARNLIKVANLNANQEMTSQSYEADLQEINPISWLIQIQQAKREKEPVYTLREERGHNRRKTFLMEVTVGNNSFIGSGPNKKLAKRYAAEGLLQQIGYTSSGPVRPAQLTDGTHDVGKSGSGAREKLGVGGSSGRQLVPGLILMADSSQTNGIASQHSTPTKGVNIQQTAAIAKEYLNGGNSPTAEAIASGSLSQTPSITSTPAISPKDQLMYLAQLLGFQVQFSDFPKGNHSEFLSLVSLSTDPPQVCHGSGASTDQSHDQAALTALRALAEMGLDHVTIKEPTMGPAGDGSYMRKGGIKMAQSPVFSTTTSLDK